MNSSDYSRYISFLQPCLTPARLAHSVRVMRVLEDLAPVYGLDVEQAMTMGLLHDAAKDLAAEEQLRLVEQAGIPIIHPCERLPIYLHAPAAACLIRQELGITDPFVLDAIAAHSFSAGGANSGSPLSWCLRAADVLEPTQNWTGMKRLRSLMVSGRMEEAALLLVGWLIEYFNELNIPVHPEMESTFSELSERLGVSNSFFDRW